MMSGTMEPLPPSTVTAAAEARMRSHALAGTIVAAQKFRAVNRENEQ